MSMSGLLLENARQSVKPLPSGTSPVPRPVFITIRRVKTSGSAIGSVRPSRPPQSWTTRVTFFNRSERTNSTSIARCRVKV